MKSKPGGWKSAGRCAISIQWARDLSASRFPLCRIAL